MNERVKQELELLRGRFESVEYVPAGHWILIRDYVLPQGSGWNREKTDVAFQIPPSRGAMPYGFYVPLGLRCKGRLPSNYKEPAQTTPPFDGVWACFSWTPVQKWAPAPQIRAGSNMVNWAVGFAQRFRESA